jgi:hypothetical protein
MQPSSRSHDGVMGVSTVASESGRSHGRLATDLGQYCNHRVANKHLTRFIPPPSGFLVIFLVNL